MKNYIVRRNNDLFDNMWNDFFRSGVSSKSLMRTDIKEDENQYMMEVEIPGFEKQDITVDFENGYLTVEAKKEQANEEKEENAQPKYLHRERVESYSRSYYHGDVDATNIKARYENGVLTLNVPKQKANNTHKIVID